MKISFKSGDEKIKVLSLVFDNKNQIDSRLDTIKEKNPNRVKIKPVLKKIESKTSKMAALIIIKRPTINRFAESDFFLIATRNT